MRLAPALVTRQVALAELTNFKYAPYAPLAQQAIMAAWLACGGYWSPTSYIFDVPCFLECQRVASVRREFLVPSLDWWIENASFKPFPSFRVGQPCVFNVSRAAQA
jgi:hypothetical protein